MNPGYVSRVLALLHSQALIERDEEGRIASVRWDELLRQWAEDAPLSDRGEFCESQILKEPEEEK